MVGVEHIGDIERLDGFRRGFGAGHEVKEMRSLAEVGADGRKFLAVAGAVEIGGDHADFRGDADGAAAVGFGRFVFEVSS